VNIVMSVFLCTSVINALLLVLRSLVLLTINDT